VRKFRRLINWVTPGKAKTGADMLEGSCIHEEFKAKALIFCGLSQRYLVHPESPMPVVELRQMWSVLLSQLIMTKRCQ
jgi:quinolinate synthase